MALYKTFIILIFQWVTGNELADSLAKTEQQFPLLMYSVC